jgi:tRNA (guanine-N7-)-methyltransferase
MRGSSKLSPAAAAVEWVPRDEHDSLDQQQLFGRTGPLEVDLGCGDGAFLAAMATEHPHHNFLGVERMIGRIRSASRKVAARELRNVRLLRADVRAAIEQHLPPASVDVFHLLFSDPWPKRRHHRRRVFNEELLQVIHRTLRPGGRFHIATDDADYFESMQQLLTDFARFKPPDKNQQLQFPSTTFEKRFCERGLPVYRLLLEV